MGVGEAADAGVRGVLPKKVGHYLVIESSGHWVIEYGAHSKEVPSDCIFQSNSLKGRGDH